MNKIVARRDKLASESGQECPTCGQPLTDEHREKVLNDWKAEGVQFGDQHRRNSVALKALAAEIAELETALKRQSVLEKDRETRQRIIGHAESRLDDLEQSLSGWRESGGMVRLAELEKALADNGQWAELQARHEALKSAAEEARRAGRELSELRSSAPPASRAGCGRSNRRQKEWLVSGLPALDEARAQLAAQSFAASGTGIELAELQGQLTAIGYDAAAHAAARARRGADRRAGGTPKSAARRGGRETAGGWPVGAGSAARAPGEARNRIAQPE